MKKSITIVWILIIAFACKSPEILPESKMKAITWELMKNSYDSATSSFKFSRNISDDDLGPLEDVFKKYQVTRQDFYHSFDVYQQDPGKFKIFIDTVIAYGGRTMFKPILSPVKSVPLNNTINGRKPILPEHH